MVEWLKDNIDKVVGFALTVGAAVFAVYRRFIRIEDKVVMIEKKLDQHIAEDAETQRKIERKMDTMSEDIRDLTVKMAAYEAVLKETSESVREVQKDIKELLRRRG